MVAVLVVLFSLSSSVEGPMIYVAQGLMVLSIIFCIRFYNKVHRTLSAVTNGMELLKEQDFSSRLALVGQYEADRVVEIFNGMMSQLKTERLRLREQNHFLDLIIQSSPMGVIILDFDGRITSVNMSAVRFLGYTETRDVEARMLSELSSLLASRLDAMEQGVTATLRVGDAMIYRCSRLSFVDSGFHHPFILIESLTADVMKAEKKAYEKVIRMIAHEVNNSVAGVTSAIESVAMELETGSDLREMMQVCVERCYGMSRFITRFADVVKIPEPVMQETNLNDCVSRCKTFMESMCHSAGIELVLKLASEPIPVRIDTGLMEHVIVNIIKNSVESISGRGNITISTSIDNSMPMICVADNGCGIDTEAANKLFTPFFSTKPNGQGLGLIFIRDVLMKHNCLFSLRTWDDGITRFQIRFQG